MNKLIFNRAMTIIIASFVCICSSCVNEEYELSKENLDLTATLFQDGVSIPLGSTSKITLGSLASMLDEDTKKYIQQLEDAYMFGVSDSFDMTKGETTNRGTVFLEPTSGESGDIINKDAFLKSNDKTVQNAPIKVKCDGGSEPQCSAVIVLPDPVDGARNDDTFMLMWSKIGGADSYRNIDVKMELCDVDNCTVESEESGGEDSRMRLDMQVVIDSTGRANDLYRRVEVRLEKEDTGSQRIYALMAKEIKKEVATCENNFEAHNCK